ncbi:hypothetical protein JOB18_042525 [Solea senegalensis]|uniref:Uncharacterized protein n=1 Tax=Solea senegalensis TaxID=28829 RepID=A0AAV6PYH0_SOLSE|nr:hypothetical protein JOB18_042525 [Solea senegalensis]
MKTLEMLVLCVTLTSMLPSCCCVEGEDVILTPAPGTISPIPTAATTATATATSGSTAPTTGSVTVTTATTLYNSGCGVFGCYSQLLVPTIALLIYSASG